MDAIFLSFYPEETPLRALLWRHSVCVRDKALWLIRETGWRRYGLDPQRVERAALLHDIGVSRCHAPGIHCMGSEPYLRHGMIGGELLRAYGSAHHLDLEEYAGEYVSRAFAEQPLDVVFESKKAALESSELRQCTCPWCGQTMQAENWLAIDHEEFISMARCDQEDEILIRMELLPTGSHRCCPRRVFYEMSDDLWEEYANRQEAEKSR